jgi:hypothetical protein
MTNHAVSLRVTQYLRIECKFWLGNDGWNGSSKHPSIAVHATSFEPAKSDMEVALANYVESVLNESRPASKGQAASAKRLFNAGQGSFVLSVQEILVHPLLKTRSSE